MHILDILGWACVIIFILICIMHLCVDTAMDSLNQVIMALFVFLSLASFTEAHRMKSAEWEPYVGTVKTVVESIAYPDVKEVMFEVSDPLTFIESLSPANKHSAHLCSKAICHALQPGDVVSMQRRWSSERHSWMMGLVRINEN